MFALAGPGLPAVHAAVGGAVVSGVVRDAQGVAQMGALVQVLSANAETVGTAFTDLRGRYVIPNLNPGRYLVRASATLFVPSTRNNLQLQSGAKAVVNLTMAALFDTTAWMPGDRRRGEDAADDWKWTLRSSANRPMLRIFEDGEVIEVSSSASEAQPAEPVQARATVSSGDGEFGGGGVHNVVVIHRALGDGTQMMARVDVGATRVPAAYGPSSNVEGGYERREGFDGASRTVLAYQSHPELVSAASGDGLQVFAMTSARRMNLGEELQVEVGGKLAGVHSGMNALEARPFLRVTAHPMGVWTLHYRMATDRQLQGFEDVSPGQTDVPVALMKDGRLELESGRHQEISVARKAGRGLVEAGLYRDALQQVRVAGGGASGPGETQASAIATGMLVDPTTGSFRTLADGYTAQGLRVSVSSPLTQGLWVAAEYSTGAALASETGGTASFAEAVRGLTVRSADSLTVALKGNVLSTGTRLRASYRWQPSNVVTPVNPYSAFSDQAFFSCLLRQPIRLGTHLPQGLAATIDVTNLLAEGYRPFLSADGQTLYFAQAPRTIQAGLSFNF